jgi:hypothetical protein
MVERIVAFVVIINKMPATKELTGQKFGLWRT